MRYLKAALLLLFVVGGTFVVLWRSAIVAGQVARATPVQSTAEQFPTKLDLNCAGCHGSGQSLPYLAGKQFHTDAHTALGGSIHAQLRPDGTPIATCKTCHTRNGDMTTALPASDPRSTINRANIAETCGQCHGDKHAMQGTGISDRLLLSYRESVHAKAIARGNTNAAVCTDCHTSHSVLPAANEQSTISKTNIAQTCGKCHASEAGQFMDSVHGQAVLRGVSRAPNCTDCHGIHDIQTPIDETSARAKSAVATDSCSKCHEGVVLTREYGVAGGRVSSYKDSYHGMASQLGSRVVANCASCHGIHNILPSSDPRSMINPANLIQTCGQCHMGASQNFVSGRMHLTSGLVPERSENDPGVFGTSVVRFIYLPLIILTIGGMVLHNALIWRKKAAVKYRSKRSVVRLSINQRVQHWLLLTSFVTLVLSGFALQYPDSWLGWALGANELLRRGIHRVAAVVMMVTGVYHVLYLALSHEGRKWMVDMFPRWKDVRDVFANLGYYLGVSGTRPNLDRFSYIEKAEYWAVVWGTLVMGLTGLMIWYKIEVFGFLPRWWIDIALAVHLYEAILATLAIIVWHFYSVIFDPDVYPVSYAFLDGRVSEEEYRHEHELDWERSRTATNADNEADEAVGGTSHPAET